MGNYVDANLGILHTNDPSLRQSERIKVADIKKQLHSLNLEDVPLEIVKAEAIVNAMPELDLGISAGVPQHEITKFYDGFTIKSITDLHTDYGDYDWKYTTRPDSYDKWTTDDQGCMYMMQNGTGKITFLCIRVPQLKLNKDETTDSYYERLLADIKRRPKFYFEKKSYYKNEYDYDYNMRELKVITAEIKGLIDKPMEYWYMDKSSWWNPWRCDMYEICTTGVVSESIYKRREIN
jgi:hypothetical protein